MKIGIMGGTFNPIHNGHLALAAVAKETAGLDEVWFMPSGLPAHKSNNELASTKLRFEMVKQGIQGISGFVASSYEIDRPGFTYTSDTVQELSKDYPQHEFFFIIGGDSLMKFHHWVKPEIISSHVTLLAAGRDDLSEESLLCQADKLHKLFGTKVLFLSMPKQDISSNKIRYYCKMGQYNEIKKYVPDLVYQYILTQKLYQK